MWNIFAVTFASASSLSAGMSSGPVDLSDGHADLFDCLPSKWSGPLLGTSRRLTAAYRRIALQHLHCHR
ncbi:unnamed protein product [Schistosoma mattheei]|uniref:Uncharacterized protein n=1 Tax=Schistosoma mattheei TaxID=31246 RepID=A0A183NZH3_9TREM|nr:unnamed protein product [Schistosoma mattheei]